MAYAEKAYRPLRPGEFYSAGFLTENQKLAYGEVLGDVEPPQIANLQPPTTASQFSRIGIIPPKGAAYQVGDSLMIAERITGYVEVRRHHLADRHGPRHRGGAEADHRR